MMSSRSYSVRGRPLITGHPAPSPAEPFCATLLAVDLHGYDALLEPLTPTEIVTRLDELFEMLTGTVLEIGGQICGVQEAGVLAGFGIGDTRCARTFEALSAARLMQARFAPLRVRWQEAHGVDSALGIGLHRGEVAFCDPLGAALRVLVGEAANGAAQLARRARAGEVLVSAAVCGPGRNLPAAPGLRNSLKRLPPLMLHGRRTPLEVWCAPLAERLPMRPPSGRRARRALQH
jgi:adenylate cyclase